jgi:hypothetical protein
MPLPELVLLDEDVNEDDDVDEDDESTHHPE